MKINAQQLNENVLLHGRTLLADGALWFNWSCSGFTLRFRGSSLKAAFRVIPDKAFAVFGPVRSQRHVIFIAVHKAEFFFLLWRKFHSPNASKSEF